MPALQGPVWLVLPCGFRNILHPSPRCSRPNTVPGRSRRLFSFSARCYWGVSPCTIPMFCDVLFRIPQGSGCLQICLEDMLTLSCAPVSRLRSKRSQNRSSATTPDNPQSPVLYPGKPGLYLLYSSIKRARPAPSPLPSIKPLLISTFLPLTHTLSSSPVRT